MDAARLERNFKLLVDAAINGARCPQSHPHGELDSGAVTVLVEQGRIKSEVYAQNFRRVLIVTGEHAGKATAAHPRFRQPYMINGRHVEPRSNAWRESVHKRARMIAR